VGGLDAGPVGRREAVFLKGPRRSCAFHAKRHFCPCANGVPKGRIRESGSLTSVAPITDYPALTPPRTAEEFQRLKRSMARHGQLHPIIKDERGSVLDGALRLLVCEELDKVALEPLEDVAVVTRRARSCATPHTRPRNVRRRTDAGATDREGIRDAGEVFTRGERRWEHRPRGKRAGLGDAAIGVGAVLAITALAGVGIHSRRHVPVSAASATSTS
jgi:hypothetical protein